ncbi:cytochrome b [Spartinivicinus poritis]|uniref:Cytochrome b n=1 Tax=Spartinivicinus poritis TaxID=2994640 RepID=A0ABT5UDA5_9GAMM|nr:cytochrome b [Spartinivicinus sp. A2-2]MDE1464359.1 cytochrome b [Spartinivicinus sp. A2-2]
MHLKNTQKQYGLVSILLHWLTALTIIGLFALGLYMVELDYYDPWYKQGPDLHKSIGLLLLVVLIFRTGWRLFTNSPKPLESHKIWERTLAHLTHIMLYLLILLVIFSGYLISTADGRPVSVFGWFDVPALVTGIDQLESYAGTVHYYLAFTLIGLASLHGLAAIKHHLFDKDDTLRRMLGTVKK